MTNHIETAHALRGRTDVHFNCCQSVLVSFAADLGLTEEQAFALGSNFGAGMRMGSACGGLTRKRLSNCCAGSEPTTGPPTAPCSCAPRKTGARRKRPTATAWSMRWSRRWRS